MSEFDGSGISRRHALGLMAATALAGLVPLSASHGYPLGSRGPGAAPEHPVQVGTGARSAAPARVTVRPGDGLQEAIDRAAPGATVAVEPGTWVETVTIDKPLTLVGLAGFRETTLVADRSRFRWSGLPRERYRVGAVNVVGTQDVTITGFTFLDALEGVWISASRRVTVVDCMSCAHTSSGFYVWGSQDVTIARCVGEDNAVGMYQGGSVDVSIVDSVFTRNRGGMIPHLDDQEYAGTGILIGNFSRGCRLIGNVAHDNTDWGFGASLGVSDVMIRANRFADNVVGVFAGTRGLELHRNDIVGNSSLGVEAAVQCDARRNWWGDASGPSGAGPGTGDGVTASVEIEPWLRDPVDAGHGAGTSS